MSDSYRLVHLHRQVALAFFFSLLLALGAVMHPTDDALATDTTFDATSLSINRIYGDTAIGTSAAQALATYPDGSSYVIVATVSSYQDALSATSLAGALDCPILLTNSNALDTVTRTALQWLKPSRIIIVGGTAAVSDTVADQLSTYGVISRLAGATAVDTNLAIYSYGAESSLWNSSTAILATNGGYWDALSIAPYAAKTSTPIFLCSDGVLPNQTLARAKADGISSYLIAGGTAAVSDTVKTQLGDDKTYSRFGGADCFDTNAKIVEWECTKQGMTLNGFALATANGFYDALSGAPRAGKLNSVIILTDTTRVSAVQTVIRNNYIPRTDPSFEVFGGTAAIPKSIVDAVASLWNLGTAQPTQTETAPPSSSPLTATVSFSNVSGADLSTNKDIDTVTVGTSASTMLPESNVLYLPASASNTLNYTFTVNSSTTSSSSMAFTEADSVDVKMPTDEEAANVVTQGIVDSTGTRITTDDGQTHAMSDLVTTQSTSGASTVAVQNSDKTVTVGVTASGQTGTIDLTTQQPNTDSKQRSYWHLVFQYTAPDGKTYNRHVYVYRSASVASMYIDTVQGLDWIQASKDNRDQGGKISMVSADGTTALYDGKLGEIKGHGNATWTYTKRPYQIKLDTKEQLIDDAGKSKTYLLLANVIDESGIRDEIGYNLADTIGLAYSSLGRTVDLYIDGEYEGSYYLCEKVQVGKNRVEINDLEDANTVANPGVAIDDIAPTVITDTSNTSFSAVEEASYTDIKSPDDVTGGYLIEMEFDGRYKDEATYFRTSRGTNFVVKSPEKASADELAYISGYVQDLEDAIYSDNGYNAKGKHFSEYLDLTSLAKYYALQESIANRDGFGSSTFFYKDKDTTNAQGKLYAGPVWDLDNSIGATTGTLSPTAADKIYVADPYSGVVLEHNWITRLLMHPEYAKLVADEYGSASIGTNVRTALDELTKTNGRVDDYAQEVKTSRGLDDLRWSIHKEAGEYPYGNGVVHNLGNWNGAFQTIKSFLMTRATALASDTSFGAYTLPSGYHTVTIDSALSTAVDTTSQYVRSGEYATIKVADGTSPTLMATYTENGSTKTVAAYTGSEAGTYYLPMPDADITVMTDTQTSFASIDAIADQTRTGQAITPDPVVKDSGGNTLVKNTDYTVEYSNNTDAGRAFVTVRSTVKPADTLTMSFLITGSINWTRTYGANAYDTMQTIVNEAFTSSDTVIVATGDSFQDALASSSLAGVYGCPVLITTSGTLPAQTEATIENLHATKVIIVGGTGAVSQTVEKSLETIAGVTSVMRITGSTSSDTSLSLYRSVSASDWSDTAIIASSTAYQDAMSISPLAYSSHMPIFLTGSDGLLSNAEASAIVSGGFSKVIIVGGTAAIPDTVIGQLGSSAEVLRLGGSDCYDTSRIIANWEINLPGGLGADNACVATGSNYYDAISASAFCGSRKSILVLADDSTTGRTCINTELRGNRASIVNGHVLGGTSAISDKLMDFIKTRTA